MIIVDELPFSFVEKEGFKNFMRVTMPQFHIPSRRTGLDNVFTITVDNASSNDVTANHKK
uniref:Uncharacterized protein n=1 Tax=Solanum lycopersicum TaxID=4081 RepID=A0A3Q7IHG4_SOLLC